MRDVPAPDDPARVTARGVATYRRRAHTLRTFRRRDGLRCLAVETPHLHGAVLAAYIGGGPRFEPAPRAGVSHLLEHMVFKGSTKYEDALSLAVATERLGGTLEAETHFEHTLYWIHPDPAELTKATGILADVLARPRLRPADLALERRVVLQECRDAREELDSDRVLTRFLWPRAGCGLHPLGSARSVRGLDASAVAHWHAAMHRPERTVLVASGVGADRRALAALAAWPGVSGRAPRLADRLGAAARGPRMIVRSGDKNRLEIRVYFRCPSYADPEDLPLWVLGEILGGGPTSRLFLDLRETRGLAYEVATSYLLYRGVGFLECRASVRPDDGPLALERILAVCGDLSRKGPAPDELARFRKIVATRMEGNLDRPEELAGWYGLRALLGPNRMEFLDEEAGRVEKIRSEEIRRLAARIFRPSARLILVQGRPGAGVRRALERIRLRAQ